MNHLAPRAASARRPLFRALGWGPRLALKEKPTKPPNQTKPNQRCPLFHDMFAFTICFTICLFISPDLDGNRGSNFAFERPDTI
jgi:hypothetical protein